MPGPCSSRSVVPLLAAAFFAAASLGVCQENKPDPKDQPRVMLTSPLGVARGTTTRVVIRGLKLDEASEVRAPGATAALVSKGKAEVPQRQEAAQVGDTQVEVDLSAPAAAGDELPLVVVTPAGETPPHAVVVVDPAGLLVEQEPNNGFGQAQPIDAKRTVAGSIESPRQVDVFRYEGTSGEQVVFEVLAARRGSALDAILTLYGPRGEILASTDDVLERDPRLEATLPAEGAYYLSLIDAHDDGGPAHAYLLRIEKR